MSIKKLKTTFGGELTIFTKSIINLQKMSKLSTWFNIPKNSDFSIYNLPFGIFSTTALTPRVGVAIGDHIIDLGGVATLDLIGVDSEILAQSSLNSFIRLGKNKTNEVRWQLQKYLLEPDSLLKEYPQLFIKQSDAKLHLPIEIGDYTDFYSSMEHATNVGKMFRDPENALLANWKHLPVAYHGRASSIVASGMPIRRPKGQILPKGKQQPIFQATQQLDFELEMAFIIGKDSKLGQSISTNEAEEYIFGMVLFNDWSARDIQRWEYVPLGPFLGKNFASSISPWVVPLEALSPFRIAGPIQEPEVLPYLQYQGAYNYDINLEVDIQTKNGSRTTVSQSNTKYLYWNMVQQLAHHTVNGCNVRVGDMMASGTISGKDENAYGSLLELTWGGTKSIELEGGIERTFLEDNDLVKMHAFAEREGKKVGFGKLWNEILP